MLKKYSDIGESLTNTERKKRFNALSRYGCCVCRRPTPEVHHLIGHNYKGMAMKANDEYTIPLCWEHHRSENGIHGMGRSKFEEVYGTQEYHLEQVNKFVEKYGR